MTEQQAKIVFFIVMGGGAIVWLLSLILALRYGTRHRSSALAGESAGAIELGELTVDGSCESIRASLVDAFRPQLLSSAAAKYGIIENSPQRVVVHKVGAIVCNQPAQLLFTDAVFQMQPVADDRVTVSYALGFDRLVRLMQTVSLALILGVGLPVMLIVGAVVWFLVIPSQAPGVRWQVFQTFQIVHALWPPIMLLWIPRYARRKSQSFVEQFLSSVGAERRFATAG